MVEDTEPPFSVLAHSLSSIRFAKGRVSQRTGLGEIILLLFVVPCNERLRLGQFLLFIFS